MKKLIVGNWKMNLDSARVEDLLEHLHADESSPEVVVCPPFPYLLKAKGALHLQMAKGVMPETSILVGAQNCHSAESGAHTGDVSAAMLVDVGCEYVILGHSERRQGHHETSYMISDKAIAATNHGLKVIICIGETEAENAEGSTQHVLRTQLEESIPDGMSAYNMVIAYEPIWAIGTGRTAGEDDITKTHAFIRKALDGLCVDANSVRILYGGSVNAKNAKSILALPNVDGVLVGGASLKAEDFNKIIQAGA